MDIAVLLFDGFDELDAVAPFEIFRNAEAFGAPFDTRLVTLDGADTVTASHGMRVGAEGALSAPGDVDLLLVPGGGWNSGRDVGVRAEYDRGAIPDAVAAHHDAGAVVASVCTGGMLLAKAGVLDGRPATTHGSALDDLRASDADVREERVVDDGDVLTAGGVTSGLDLALHVVAREAGADVADRVADEIEYDRRFEPYVAD
ncbi:DJ-1/PfpI family protein [Halobaculum sp. P14]|uniref:DJ-1/PfpI family protein n=1 Tax=Halobaculum sp. P14 TaxID=3421638 RepID=UPI003EBD3FBE